MTENQRQPASEPFDLARLDDGDILALVQSRSRRFDRQIRFRDCRELVAAGIVAVFIAPATVHGTLLGRLGAVIILAGLVLVALRLWRARHVAGHSRSDLSLPVTLALRAELEQIDAQIGLLESVGVWYVAPLLGGSVLLVAGSANHSLAFKMGYVVFAGFLAWGIIALNRRAVRRTLLPKRRNVIALLAQLQ